MWKFSGHDSILWARWDHWEIRSLMLFAVKTRERAETVLNNKQHIPNSQNQILLSWSSGVWSGARWFNHYVPTSKKPTNFYSHTKLLSTPPMKHILRYWCSTNKTRTRRCCRSQRIRRRHCKNTMTTSVYTHGLYNPIKLQLRYDPTYFEIQTRVLCLFKDGCFNLHTQLPRTCGIL